MAEMRFDNAREPEQLRRMQELAKKGICYFCREGFEERHDAPIIQERAHWLIAANNYPYEKGSYFHHYLLVIKRHITKVSDLLPPEQDEFFEMIKWLENHLQVPGESIFVRSGDIAYTGASLDHLHFHFLAGVAKNEQSEPVRVKLAYKLKSGT